jgi:putative aldouronate transport system permease protein
MSKFRRSPDVILFNIIGYSFLLFFALLCILPFWIIIVGSITSETHITRFGYSIIPVEFVTDAYKYVMTDSEGILRAYGVTTFVTISGTFLSVLVNSMTAYVLHRKDFKYRNFFSFYFFFTTLFSGGLVPWYILITNYLNMKNNLLVLIIPGLVSVWNILVMKGFLQGIPSSLTESALIDGAGDFKIYTKIIIPLSKPVIATISLFTALGFWNDWYASMLFINNDKLYSLQFYLFRLLGNAQGLKIAAEKAGLYIQSPPIQATKMAMTLIVIGPIMLLYPFVQKYFVKGITLGAVKG